MMVMMMMMKNIKMRVMLRMQVMSMRHCDSIVTDVSAACNKSKETTILYMLIIVFHGGYSNKTCFSVGKSGLQVRQTHFLAIPDLETCLHPSDL